MQEGDEWVTDLSLNNSHHSPQEQNRNRDRKREEEEDTNLHILHHIQSPVTLLAPPF